jgi:pyridoxamine 5'-phosphate oxidase family protein
MSLTDTERAYLATQRLGRLATLAADGTLQNNPVGFFYDAESGTVTIGGRRLGDTRKFRNVAATGEVAFVVDDLAPGEEWHPRGVEIRGRAEALTDQEPPARGFGRDIIRIHPRRVLSWGLADDGARMHRRDVTPTVTAG